MPSINERLIQLREVLNVSQDEFGRKIGISRFSISNLESGKRAITERVLKDICREFNVNYDWLKDGEGEMFEDYPETTLDMMKEEYNLDDMDMKIIREYLKLDNTSRQIIKNYIKKIQSDE